MNSQNKIPAVLTLQVEMLFWDNFLGLCTESSLSTGILLTTSRLPTKNGIVVSGGFWTLNIGHQFKALNIKKPFFHMGIWRLILPYLIPFYWISTSLQPYAPLLQTLANLWLKVELLDLDPSILWLGFDSA